MMKRDLMSKAFLFLIAALLVLAGSVNFTFAETSGTKRYTNPETGYSVYIIDDAYLLSESEEEALVEDMKPITDFGHIIFWSTKTGAINEISQAQDMRFIVCGDESSGIFAINMKEHTVTFQSDGKIYEYVSRSYARSITDNVSGYASSGDYYSCASEAFSQVLSVLRGNRIAEPMKYISFVVIGLMLSFVIVVGLVFSKWLNPLIKRRHKAIRVEQGEYVVGDAQFAKIDSHPRAWVTILRGIGVAILYMFLGFLKALLKGLLSGGGSSGSSSGGSSRSSGGSSRSSGGSSRSSGGSSSSGRSGGGGGSSRF